MIFTAARNPTVPQCTKEAVQALQDFTFEAKSELSTHGGENIQGQ